MYYLEIQGLLTQAVNLKGFSILYEPCIMIILTCPYTPLPPPLELASPAHKIEPPIESSICFRSEKIKKIKKIKNKNVYCTVPLWK